MVEKELPEDGTIAEEVDTFTDVAPMDSGLEAVLSTLTKGDFVAQGGQAQVHRVKKGDVDVAARSVSIIDRDDLIKRLKREARILRGLQHENIVGYQGYEVNPVKKRWGTDVEFTFYMGWIEGPTLRDILEEGKAHRELSGGETDAIFAQLGSALSYCHDRGVLHRDMKPSNVKLMEGDVVKVIDFGLVKKEGETTMTGSEGRFLGSHKYAAPEVRGGNKAEAASDWYSAAVMTVEMLSGKPYTTVVDPADVRRKLGKMSMLPPRLKESLELLLEEDVTVRAKNVERVKRMYGLGKVVEVVESVNDTVNEKKEKISIWEEKFDRVDSAYRIGVYSAALSAGSTGLIITLSDNFKFDNITGGMIAAGFGSSVLGYLIGNYYDSAKAKIKSLLKRKKEDGSLEKKVGEIGQPIFVDDGIAENSTVEASDLLENKVSEPSIIPLKEYDREVSKKKIWAGFYGDVSGVAAGGVGSILIQYFMDSGYSVSQTLASMVIGGITGGVAGRLYHKYVEVPRLRQKYGLEEKVEESDTEKSVTSLTREEKRAKISEVRMVWDAKQFSHSFYAGLDILFTGTLAYTAVEVFRDYGTKPGMILLALAATAGLDLVRHITKRKVVRDNLQFLETNPDQALVLYEEEKKGLVQRMRGRYDSWREEKGREWVEKNYTNFYFSDKMKDYAKKGISSKGIRRRILPALHHWSTDIKRMALEVILNNDEEKQEYREEVERVFPKIIGSINQDVYCRILTYLSACPPNVNKEEVIKDHLLPTLDCLQIGIKKHALSLLTTLEPEAEVKYQAEIARARESIAREDDEDFSDNPWHYVNPLKHPK